MHKTRLRIRFTKTGDLRWISHRDLARLWERLLRRSNLELAFSQGFHPKPKISFPSALALGIEAFDEVVELELEGEFELEDVRQRIDRELPIGMQLLSIEIMPVGAPKAQVVANKFRVELPNDYREATCRQIESVLAQPQLEVVREGKSIIASTLSPHFNLYVDDGWLYFMLPFTRDGSLRPSELLDCVGLGDLLEQGAVLQRIEVVLETVARAGTNDLSADSGEREDASHDAAMDNQSY